MSSATSDVTYTSVYTDSEPGRAFWGADYEGIPEGGIPRVRNHRDTPVPQEEDEREPLFIQAHDPNYVPEPIYPEYIPLEDDHEFPAEEQPLPPIDSPTAESPGYITESDPEEDPEGDDARDEDEDRGRMRRTRRRRSTLLRLTLLPSYLQMKASFPLRERAIIPPPSTDITIGARFTHPTQTPPEAEVERLLVMTTPSPSPPVSLSPPSTGEHIARCTAPPAHLSPPPMPSPLLPSFGCLTQIQTLRIASTQALIDAVTAALLSPPLPPLPPSLYIPPPVTIGTRFPSLSSHLARGIRDVGYGIRDTWVDPAEAVPKIAPVTLGEVNTRVINLAELHEHDTQDLYALLEDAQDSRSRISQRVDMNSHRVDLLMGDRMTFQETIWMVEEEAYASLEAWARSIGLSQATH
ncbi:hypothetical protein Tco_0353019 [Tanacetum coccineum]